MEADRKNKKSHEELKIKYESFNSVVQYAEGIKYVAYYFYIIPKKWTIQSPSTHFLCHFSILRCSKIIIINIYALILRIFYFTI